MRGATGMREILGGRFALTLAVLAIVGAARVVTASPESFTAGGNGLVQAYFSFTGADIATCLFVPLFAMGTSRLLGSLSFSALLVRRGRRSDALVARVPGLLACSILYSAVILACSVTALVLKSGLLFPAGEIAAFCALQLAFASLFFLTEGLLIVDVQMLMGSNVMGMVVAVLYGTFDSFLSMVVPNATGTFWTGWMLVAAGDPSEPALALSGFARLLALAVVFAALAWVLVRRVDFMDGEDSHER